MSAKGSRKFKVGDMVQWQIAFALDSNKYIGIVIERKGALCGIKWFDFRAGIDYIYASDLEKVS
jgi:hypothetical protein